MRSAKGSVRSLGRNRYIVRVEAAPDPVTGDRVRPSKTVRGTRRYAEEVKVAMLAEVGDTDEARRKMTLESFWRDMYLPNAEKRLRETTVAGYENHYKVHIQQALGGMLLTRITPSVINAWLNGIEGDKRKFEAYKMLRTILSRAVRCDLIDSNPCMRIDAPKRDAYNFETLDWQDVQVYVWHYERTEIGAFILAVIGGGFTRSEGVALDWEDITTDGVATIDNAITSLGGKPHDDLPKNRFRERKVKLPAIITAKLNAMRGEGPICKDSNGNRMNPDNVTKLYSRYQKTLPDKCPRIPLKDLRHTSLSLAIDAGADVYAVSRRAGHSSVTTTEKFYLKPHGEIDETVSNAMDSLF